MNRLQTDTRYFQIFDVRRNSYIRRVNKQSIAGEAFSLDATGLRSYFKATRTVDEAPSKPAPDMLEELLWETDTPPGRALMVGDSEYDLAMARNAQVASVGVLCGVHDAQTLRRCNPLGLIAHVAELPMWLAAQSRRRA